MKIGKPIVGPSYSREPAYKTGDDKTLEYEWQCTTCHGQIAIRYSDIAPGKRAFSEAEIQELKDYFKIGYVGKSQDGGWPEFLKVPCPRCNTVFVVYAGVKEPANSFLLVTIQGIAEIRKEQDAQPPAGPYGSPAAGSPSGQP